MPNNKKFNPSESVHPATLVLHGGDYRSDPTTNAVAVPIYQTTSYQFNDTEHAANLFALKDFGNIYSRIMNPTLDVLEKRIAALEGGVGALALSSGQSASAISVQNLARSGDNIVCSTDVYGGTFNLFSNTLKDQGIEVRFADPSDPENFRKLTDDNTRAYYGESLPNPKLKVFPIKEVADIGKEYNIPLIIDNTAAPVICKPIEHGATIVVHSLTKFIGGHGTSIGGIIVDSGKFDWAKDPKRIPTLNEPDQSYHGAVWTEATKPLGPIAYIIRARVVLLRDLGSALSPFNAFQIIQGLETLSLRMERHCDNASKVADFLSGHNKVTKVIFAGKEEGIAAERSKKYLKGGFGALLGFELKSGKQGGQKFIENLNMLYHVANIGDSRSLAIHPASTTHSQLSDTDMKAAGVSPSYVRLSIGLEHVDDIIADISNALDAA
ncbi:MAG: O-acetylhomoserine aminocarboxypropyltransferase/cysteine synthase family protein [Candidatus Pelagibacterales bacterium]|jgi:O-acetylhomoserine (thiol)-lyase